MRHADAELQLWIANDRIAREHRDAELAALARNARHGSENPTLRQRAGSVLIAAGERLAGTGTQGHRTTRLAHRAS